MCVHKCVCTHQHLLCVRKSSRQSFVSSNGFKFHNNLRYCHHPHFPDEKTEAEKGWMTCPRSHSHWMAELGFELRASGYSACVCNPHDGWVVKSFGNMRSRSPGPPNPAPPETRHRPCGSRIFPQRMVASFWHLHEQQTLKNRLASQAEHCPALALQEQVPRCSQERQFSGCPNLLIAPACSAWLDPACWGKTANSHSPTGGALWQQRQQELIRPLTARSSGQLPAGTSSKILPRELFLPQHAYHVTLFYFLHNTYWNLKFSNLLNHLCLLLVCLGPSEFKLRKNPTSLAPSGWHIVGTQ